MDRHTRYFVKLYCIAFEDLVSKPAEKHERTDCCRQAKQ